MFLFISSLLYLMCCVYISYHEVTNVYGWIIVLNMVSYKQTLTVFIDIADVIYNTVKYDI